MSTLRFEKITMPGANLGKAGEYPLFFQLKIRKPKASILDETEGLFLNYSRVKHGLPYTSLGSYDHAEELQEFDAFILENDFLKAVFIPSLGGRLWSLYDKVGKRDLILANPVFRPCNLSLRNAWISGGVEWNCGIPSHHPLTCDRVYGAMYKAEDGTPVLRLYSFERSRAVTYQMDFFLPEDSRTLFARMRLVNASEEVTPIYWWSTIAVEQKEGSRVIVPTDETYVHHSSDPCYKTQIPMINGVDTSYPTNHRESTDHFFKIPEEKRKFVAYLNADGTGFVHSSTRRLKGRKMFVWGTSRGGDNWQKLLTSKDGKPYLELQAGLAYTQQESVPFPPNTAWEWLEAYSPLEMDPAEAHGEYKQARMRVEELLDEMLPEERMNEMLAATKPEALKAVPYVFKGHPWGTLENELREATGRKKISPHLEFGEMGDEQKLWLDFLRNGYLEEPDPTEAPKSFMIQEEWFRMLKKTVRKADRFNWFAWYQLALGYYARDEYELAQEMFEKSLELKTNTWAYHGLACALLAQDELADGAAVMAKAVAMNSGNLTLAKDAMRLCEHFGQHAVTAAIYEKVSDECKQVPMLRGYYAASLAYLGKPEVTKAILEENGGLFIHDMREGDETVTNGYIHAIQELARREGKELAVDEVDVPEKIDFRMYRPDKR